MEPFWYDDFSVLYDIQYITKFYPSQSMNYTEKLNASMRFVIYFTFLLMFFKQNAQFIYLIPLALLISYYLYQKKDLFEKKELFNGAYLDNKMNPTYDNPFANPNLIVHQKEQYLPKQNPNKKVRFDVNHHMDTNDDIQRNADMNEKFNARLYMNVSDVFEKEASQRTFYSVPVRTYPNDQTAFAQWCYGLSGTCKGGEYKKCLNYNDELRGHADPLAIKETGPGYPATRKDWF